MKKRTKLPSAMNHIYLPNVVQLGNHDNARFIKKTLFKCRTIVHDEYDFVNHELSNVVVDKELTLPQKLNHFFDYCLDHGHAVFQVLGVWPMSGKSLS